MINRILTLLSALVLSAILISSAQAVVPSVINFQGHLSVADGSPPPDDIYSITFSLWDDPDAGNELWSEIQQVQVQDGQFNVPLGSETPIPVDQLSLNFQKIYLQTEVLGDSPMAPRVPFNSVPYAMVSNRVDGDIRTAPGSLTVSVEPSQFKYAKIEGTDVEVKLKFGEQDDDFIELKADNTESSMSMKYVINPTYYPLSLSSDENKSSLRVSKFGPLGEDGFSVNIFEDSSMLGVSKINTNSTEGFIVGVNANAATCGIEHEDIGGAISSANSSADDSGGRHEVAHNLSQYDFSIADIKADVTGAGLFAVDSFFDIEYRIDYHAFDYEAASRIQADDGIKLFKREDKATPNLYQATCEGSHENGHSFITELIDNQGSSGEYKWQPQIGDEVIVGFSANGDGGHVVGSDTFAGVPYEFDLGTQELSFTKFLPDGTPVRAAQYGPGGDFVVDSFFDIEYRIARSVTDTGALLTVTNLGPTGQEDGVILLSSDSRSGLTIAEGGNNRVSLSSDGSLDRLTLGDLDSDGSLDLVAGTSGGDLSVFFQGPTGEDVARVSAGSGNGARFSLGKLPAGETIPVEIVSLSLNSAEPVVAVRKYDAQPTDVPILSFDYDVYDRLVTTNRNQGTGPSDSTKISPDGFHIFNGPNQLNLDLGGLTSFGPTGPIFSITASGEISTPANVAMAYDATGLSMVGIGTQTPNEKLYVDGNICATGFIGPCSDLRYKKNIENIDNAVGIVSRLRGVRFDWRVKEFSDKHFSDARQVGLIAQEVREVVPEVVSQGSDGYYSVDYSRLTPILIEALKEQQRTIESLQSELNENIELRAEVRDLRNIVRQLAVKMDDLKNGAEVRKTAN